MTTNPTWIQHSRIEWHSAETGDGFPGIERVQLGCLQRIATAVEKVAQDRIRLEEQVKTLQARVDYMSKEALQNERRIAAYRGIIKKLKEQT